MIANGRVQVGSKILIVTERPNNEELLSRMAEEPKLALVQQYERIVFAKSSRQIAELILGELSEAEIRAASHSYGIGE